MYAFEFSYNSLGFCCGAAEIGHLYYCDDFVDDTYSKHTSGMLLATNRADLVLDVREKMNNLSTQVICHTIAPPTADHAERTLNRFLQDVGFKRVATFRNSNTRRWLYQWSYIRHSVKPKKTGAKKNVRR